MATEGKTIGELFAKYMKGTTDLFEDMRYRNERLRNAEASLVTAMTDLLNDLRGERERKAEAKVAPKTEQTTLTRDLVELSTNVSKSTTAKEEGDSVDVGGKIAAASCPASHIGLSIDKINCVSGRIIPTSMAAREYGKGKSGGGDSDSGGFNQNRGKMEMSHHRSSTSGQSHRQKDAAKHWSYRFPHLMKYEMLRNGIIWPSLRTSSKSKREVMIQTV